MSSYGTDDITFCSHDRCNQRSCARHICNRINKDMPYYSVADYKDTKFCPATYNDITLDEYVALRGTERGDYGRQKEMSDMRDCGFTLNEIGAKYGISRQRVHQILNKNKKVRTRDESYSMQRRRTRLL